MLSKLLMILNTNEITIQRREWRKSIYRLHHCCENRCHEKLTLNCFILHSWNFTQSCADAMNFYASKWKCMHCTDSSRIFDEKTVGALHYNKYQTSVIWNSIPITQPSCQSDAQNLHTSSRPICVHPTFFTTHHIANIQFNISKRLKWWYGHYRSTKSVVMHSVHYFGDDKPLYSNSIIRLTEKLLFVSFEIQ